MTKEYETVIGLEVHVELATKTKIFCSCENRFGREPNTQTCPVCLGMPGSLPVLNRRAAEFAILAGLSMGCEISRFTVFDRKNYFYPDNPQNYQISQLYLPVCKNGCVEVTADGGRKRIGIREIHMEEDAGKLIHDGDGRTLVDYNRAGVPLIEIVSKPDMRSAREAVAYLEKLRDILRYLGISDCRMQEGSLRADVNLSVREAGSGKLKTRTEMKNLNSLRAVGRAIGEEKKRQIALLERGEAVVQETRRWDDGEGRSYVMRGKEDARDYRYFPEPDLTPVEISGEWIGELKKRLPEFREEKRERFGREYGLSDYDTGILTESKRMADLFERVAAISGRPKKAANWLMGETMRLLKEREMAPEDIRFSPGHLAKLIEMADSGIVSGAKAKEVFAVMFDEDMDPAEYVEEHSLNTLTDEGALEKQVLKVMEENPQSVRDYRSGKKKALGFLVGQTMRAMEGKADPGAVNRILTCKLSGNTSDTAL